MKSLAYFIVLCLFVPKLYAVSVVDTYCSPVWDTPFEVVNHVEFIE